MSYQKPKGLLLDKPIKRKVPKSSFLRKLERQQMEQRIIAEAMARQDKCVLSKQIGSNNNIFPLTYFGVKPRHD